jgi:hypothetical protein
MRRPRDDRQNDLFQPLHETSSICASMVRLAEEVDCDFLGRAFRPGSAARPRPAAVADAEERTAGLLKIAVNYRKKTWRSTIVNRTAAFETCFARRPIVQRPLNPTERVRLRMPLLMPVQGHAGTSSIPNYFYYDDS